MTKITILDSNDIPNPESRAVLQALASRSTLHINEQKDRVNTDRTDRFIDMNCISYGHDSVLENADGIIVNIFGCSMLAAKAIEDTMRFKGTEASTRYIDITGIPSVHLGSYNTSDEMIRRGETIQKQYDFFNQNMPFVKNFMKERFPYAFLAEQQQSYSEVVYEKAIAAKAFDVMRSFLPPGAPTIVNWTSDLRTLKDRLTELLAHPLIEVQQLATQIAESLQERYPVSFKNFPNMEVVEHIKKFNREYHMFDENPYYGPEDVWAPEDLSYNKFSIAYIKGEIENIKNNYPSLQTRPRGSYLPRMYASRLNISGLMDFGSFRDIQRQRNGICKIPMIEEKYGFEKWYLEQLPSDVKDKAEVHLSEVSQSISDIDPLDKQYFIPFGYRVPYLLDYSLEQMVYVAELRSSRHVHPTCRLPALAVTRFLNEVYPFIAVHADKSMSDFDIKRGTQDINI